MPALRVTCRVTPGGLRRDDSPHPLWPMLVIDSAMNLGLENCNLSSKRSMNILSVSMLVEGSISVHYFCMFGHDDH